MFCPDCGKQVKEDAKYCTNCGHSLFEDAKSKTTDEIKEPRESISERQETIGDIRCPICGSKTTIRTAKKGPDAGSKFHVCVNYPRCKGKVY